jgi:signal transduction histidine kinase
MLRSSLDRSAVVVQVDVDADLPHVRGGQGDLERMLFNLVTNARDAMTEGGRLTVSARRQNRRVELRVQDDGAGMEPAVLKRIYEPGYTTKDEGSGLGLAVCRAIAWGCGGEIEIQSVPAKGTEVRIVLHIAEGEDARL